LAAPRGRHHSCPCVDRDAAHFGSDDLRLADVHSRPQLDPQLADGVEDCPSAPNGFCWGLKGDEEPISRGVEFLAPESFQLCPEKEVVPSKKLSPPAVPHLDGEI